jgi:hypothetical protein
MGSVCRFLIKGDGFVTLLLFSNHSYHQIIPSELIPWGFGPALSVNV